MEYTLKELTHALQVLADYWQRQEEYTTANLIREAIARLKQTGRRARG